MTIDQKAEAYANEKWPGAGQIYWRSLIVAAVLFGYALREEERTNKLMKALEAADEIPFGIASSAVEEANAEVDFEFEE